MARVTSLVVFLAAAAAFLSSPSAAQQAGFESVPRVLGCPEGISGLQVGDLTADGTLDVVALHESKLSLFNGPNLYADDAGSALVTPLAGGVTAVRDFALTPDLGPLLAAGALTVSGHGLELVTWEAGSVYAGQLLSAPDARLVAQWTVAESSFTVVSVIEQQPQMQATLKSIVLLKSNGELFAAYPPVGLGTTWIRDIELLNWDGDGGPEVAALRDSSIEVFQLDGFLSAQFDMIDPGAQMAVLGYGTEATDRLLRSDRDPETGAWVLAVLDGTGVEEDPVPLNTAPLHLATGLHDADDLPDALVTYASGHSALHVHRSQTEGPSFDLAGVHGVFSGSVAQPDPPVLAAVVADMDGDGDGDVVVADSSAQLWCAYGKPVDAADWEVWVNEGLDVDDIPDGVLVSFDVTLPVFPPDAGGTHVEVVAWEGSSESVTDPTMRVQSMESADKECLTVSIPLPLPEPGGAIVYVAEVRLLDVGPPRHAYPAIWGEVTITLDLPPDDPRDPKGPLASGGGMLRGTFAAIPPGSPPPAFPPGSQP